MIMFGKKDSCFDLPTNLVGCGWHLYDVFARHALARTKTKKDYSVLGRWQKKKMKMSTEYINGKNAGMVWNWNCCVAIFM